MRLRVWTGLVIALSACGSSGGSGADGGGGADGGDPAVDAAVVPGPTLVAMSSGASDTCVILTDKTVRCWGDGRGGQLGNGTMVSSTKPVPVTGLTNAVAISVGYEHSCAVIEGGTVTCWGRNTLGQLGNNSKDDSPIPVPVMGLTGVKSVQAGVYASCALTTTGNVLCWGRGGDVGDNGVADQLVPHMVPTLSNVTQLSVTANAGRSSSMHACGVRMNGTAFCWGGNDAGQLGDGTQNPARVPVDVMGVTDAIEITAGGGHACARRTSGLSCWGFSQLVGDGTNMQRFTATPVSTTEMVNVLSAGNEFTLARTTANRLICWGQWGRGQCGDGAAFVAGGNVYQMPVSTLLTDVALFAAGGTHACAYTSAGVTSCWGSNEYGELGSGEPSSLSRTTTPAVVVW